MLDHSRNFVMEQPILNDYSVNTMLNTGSPGLDKLRQHICVDAAHDSSVNHFSKSACSPDTRKSILQKLADWMNDPNPAHKIIWLHGPAGAGKSAIAQSTMQRAVNDQHLAASFFFSRGAPGRSNADHLFPTIAYQITRNIRTLAHPVEQTMVRHPEIPSKNFEIQFRELIDRPAQENNILDYPVIGIDGIDECDDETVQIAFLTVIANAVVSGQCPFRFIISSRPESHLLRLFTQNFDTHTQKISLETSKEALDDVETYLRTEFAKICQLHMSFMQHITQPWPSNDDILRLRGRSSGHFIYAATVIRFVGGDKYRNPVNQLDIILRPTLETEVALGARPYSELDRLYLQVLLTHPDPVYLLKILTFLAPRAVIRSILIEPPYFRTFTPDLLDDLLGAQPGTTETVLSGINSLVKFSPTRIFRTRHDETIIGFHHASFEEFLLDSTRSGHFHIDHNSLLQVKKAYAELLIRWLVEADQDINVNVSELYLPIRANTILEGFSYSTRQLNFDRLCNYLRFFNKSYDPNMTPYMLRIIESIPCKPGILPNHMWFILHGLTDMFDDWIEHQPASIRLSHGALMPLRRLHGAFESYLKHDNSQNLRFLLNLPGMYSHSRLPITLFSTIYRINNGTLFTLIRDSYPFLSIFHLSSPFPDGSCFEVSSVFMKFLKKTPRLKHYLDKTGTTIIGRCLDYLHEIGLITKDGHLSRPPEEPVHELLAWLTESLHIIFDEDHILSFLSAHLASKGSKLAIIKVIEQQYNQFRFNDNHPLTKEPTSNIRINICFLTLMPIECLEPAFNSKDTDLSLIQVGFPLMSTGSSIGHDPEYKKLVREVHVPKGVLRWELNILFEVFEGRKENLTLIMHTSTAIKENKQLLKKLWLLSRNHKLREITLPTSEKLRGVYRAKSTNFIHPFLLHRPPRSP